jgi:hypothetical protein
MTDNMKLGAKLHSMLKPVSMDEEKIDYPDLHVHDAPKELWDAPEKGTATVKYHIVNRSQAKRDGKDSYSCTIEIHDFEPEKKKEEPKKRSYGSGPLDKTKKRMDQYFDSKK